MKTLSLTTKILPIVLLSSLVAAAEPDDEYLNAKPEVVDAERARLADLETQQASLTAHLSELGT